jgi:alpha-amylase/alpha-mannosidase (GH57 family)
MLLEYRYAKAACTIRSSERVLSMNDSYPRTGKTLYLNIIWHQHQPLYLDPASDQLQGPWVRTHGTKDYYDMAAILEKYPDIHFTVNLTSSLLVQLQTYYVNRLGPFLNKKKNCIDERKYFAKYAGKTDPWIDIALKPTSEFNEHDLRYLLDNVWNAFGVNDTIISRFPQYRTLKEKFAQAGRKGLTEQDLREIKFWFFLAYFDPDFLDQKQELATGATVDLTDLVEKKPEGTYSLRKPIGDGDCNRIIAETVKILNAIVPIHKKLMYHPDSYKGQIEIVTTPFYHPILPLVYDSDLAKLCQPNDPMPSRFHYPKDAEMQVSKAIQAFRRVFGMKPTGMWPAEGAVAHDIISVFAHQGIQWIATDQKILERSKPGGQSPLYPYVIDAGPDGKNKNAVVAVFRETSLSDKIGFVYKDFQGEDAADDFIREVLSYAPKDEEPDRLLTVILDGENAWEWYRYDNDGKNFQNALYRKLSNLFRTRQIVTATVTEYLRGNPIRGIPAHPPEMLPRIEWLWPGSWINANFDTWIGEDEENRAWEYLLQAREDLAQSGLQQPDPKAKTPKEETKAWFAFRAWESLYAAEGSDWFWWYGTDQNAPAGDKPFDLAFITHLRNIYKFAGLAGGKMPKRDFKPIIVENAQSVSRPGQGTMAQSKDETVRVTFQCDARGMYVRKSLYIAGNHKSLGNWVPNKVRMFDDGTHGDLKASDSIWTVEIDLPSGIEIEYKYTNSGAEGNWHPGEEFASLNRRIRIEPRGSQKMVVIDKFGQL